MKILTNETDAPFVGADGYLHLDGDAWHELPREFWTQKARHLFDAARKAGILQLSETGPRMYNYVPNPALDWALLAWWCMRASKYLGLDRKSTTCWKPFEEALGLPRRSLSRATGPLDIDRNEYKEIVSWRSDYTREIDVFFAALEEEDAPDSTTQLQ